MPSPQAFTLLCCPFCGSEEEWVGSGADHLLVCPEAPREVDYSYLRGSPP